MKKLVLLLVVAEIFIAYSNVSAQTQNPPQPKQHGKNFVDKNGDGYNDYAPDHDGDGIPNGLDPDFLAIKNKNAGKFGMNPDGTKETPGKGKHGNNGKGGLGPADGTGNKGLGPKNGTGNNSGDGTTMPGNNRGGKKWGKK
jgi:hypothetical protein